MAENNNSTPPKIGTFRKLANTIQSGINDLYKNIYYSDPSNKQQLQNIKTDMTDTIKNIMNTAASNFGEPNISKLYERLLLTQNDKSIITDFERIFGNNEFVSNLTSSYLDNRWVRTVDMELDEVCKYMPKLQEALNTITDNILSADSFHKDYLNIVNDLSNSNTTDEQFAHNIDELKTIYDLSKLIKEIYNKESKYGETFIYIVPYDKAIQRLMDRKNKTSITKVTATESTITITSLPNEYGYISENAINQTIPLRNQSTSSIHNMTTLECNYDIKIDDGIIVSIVEQEMNTRKKYLALKEQSITEAQQLDFQTFGKSYIYNDTINNQSHEEKLPRHKRFDITIGDRLEIPDYDKDTTSSDGLVNTSGGKIKAINGCIVKILKREKVVPIILNKVCLGYYYFEYDQNLDMFGQRAASTGMINTLTGIRSNHRSESFDALQRREELLRSLSNELAKKIDIKFIDANQDLKKEIYYILKYNDEFNSALQSGMSNNIRVSYIPPDDIEHLYFDLDEETGRGISDLNLSLIPAKLWVAITLCNVIGILTRSNDKRVYYVRQSTETNVAKTMLRTIEEIKKANFGIRQIENINSVLNITGRFNDYIIPKSADGQSPIDMEVLQGQQIDVKTDLLSMLEEHAINLTGIPLDLIQSRQSPDYAMQFTMSSSKFLRFAYDRQSAFSAQISRILTKIYDLEYNTKDRLQVQLPPPLFINMQQTNQLFTTTKEFCQNIVEIMMAGDDDDMKKQIFNKELILHFLGSYIKIDDINRLYDKASQQVAKANNVKDEGNGDDSGGGF